MGLLVHLPQEYGTVGSVNHKREQPEWYVRWLCVCICSVWVCVVKCVCMCSVECMYVVSWKCGVPVYLWQMLAQV